MGREAENHIRVTDETWQELNARKRPGDSFDDVLQRLINDYDGEEGTEDSEGNPKMATASN